MTDEENGLRSECCDAPITFYYAGPVCTKCKKWTTTKSDPREVKD